MQRPALPQGLYEIVIPEVSCPGHTSIARTTSSKLLLAQYSITAHRNATLFRKTAEVYIFCPLREPGDLCVNFFEQEVVANFATHVLEMLYPRNWKSSVYLLLDKLYPKPFSTRRGHI